MNQNSEKHKLQTFACYMLASYFLTNIVSYNRNWSVGWNRV